MGKPIAEWSEHDHQKALFNRCKQELARYPELEWLYAIPNQGTGGSQSIRRGKIMKAEGLKKGVPDVCLPVPRLIKSAFGDDFILYGSLRIEMKIKGNSPTPEQKKWIAGLRRMQNKVEICYDYREAWAHLLIYLGYPYDVFDGEYNFWEKILKENKE